VFERRFIPGNVIVFVLVLLIGVTALYESLLVSSTSDTVEWHYKTLGSLERLQNKLTSAENAKLEFLLSGKKEMRNSYSQKKAEVINALKNLNDTIDYESVGIRTVYLLDEKVIDVLDSSTKDMTPAGASRVLWMPLQKQIFVPLQKEIPKNRYASINKCIDVIREDINWSSNEAMEYKARMTRIAQGIYLAATVIILLILLVTYIMHGQEIKRRTKVEYDLHESQRLYQTIAKNFPDGTINVLDKNLNYVFTEGKELQKYDITSEGLIGKSYLEKIPDKNREMMRTKLSEIFERKTFNVTSQFIYQGRYYLLHAVALWNINNQIDEILVVEQNITAQKRAEEDIKSSLDKEKHLNELTSLIVSVASHEFRTPLGTIVSSAELVGKYLNSDNYDLAGIKEKCFRHLKRIQTSVDNLVNILNGFISLEKLEEGKIEVNPEYFDFSSLVNEVIEEMQTTLKPGQTINFKYKGSAEKLFLDQQMLKNVLINLLSNASKYSSDNTHIDFTSSLNGKGLEMEIRDYGIGIPDNEQKHLFENFFRASNAGTIRGIGLGLNIVKRYNDLMNGKITFISKEGKGTTFKINIPVPAML
jgi:signal transduction histidine kinase